MLLHQPLEVLLFPFWLSKSWTACELGTKGDSNLELPGLCKPPEGVRKATSRSHPGAAARALGEGDLTGSVTVREQVLCSILSSPYQLADPTAHGLSKPALCHVHAGGTLLLVLPFSEGLFPRETPRTHGRMLQRHSHLRGLGGVFGE